MPDKKTNRSTRTEGLQQFRETAERTASVGAVQPDTGIHRLAQDVHLASKVSGPGLTVKQMCALIDFFRLQQPILLMKFLPPVKQK